MKMTITLNLKKLISWERRCTVLKSSSSPMMRNAPPPSWRKGPTLLWYNTRNNVTLSVDIIQPFRLPLEIRFTWWVTSMQCPTSPSPWSSVGSATPPRSLPTPLPRTSWSSMLAVRQIPALTCTGIKDLRTLPSRSWSVVINDKPWDRLIRERFRSTRRWQTITIKFGSSVVWGYVQPPMRGLMATFNCVWTPRLVQTETLPIGSLACSRSQWGGPSTLPWLRRRPPGRRSLSPSRRGVRSTTVRRATLWWRSQWRWPWLSL